MIYRSNLTAPDLAPLFAEILLDPAFTIMGHDAPSHKRIEPGCTFWTHDEAAILYNIAAAIESRVSLSHWIDIGARFGWTGRHIAAAQAPTSAIWLVDPLFLNGEAAEFVMETIQKPGLFLSPLLSKEFFRMRRKQATRFDGFVIDGNHDTPEPTLDAEGALQVAAADCVIVFHDFYGGPIQDAVRYLMQNGFRTRVYWTPNGVACCWRGFDGWMPPVHRRDPDIEWLGHIHQVKQNIDLRACV